MITSLASTLKKKLRRKGLTKMFNLVPDWSCPIAKIHGSRQNK